MLELEAVVPFQKSHCARRTQGEAPLSGVCHARTAVGRDACYLHHATTAPLEAIVQREESAVRSPQTLPACVISACQAPNLMVPTLVAKVKRFPRNPRVRVATPGAGM